jgi:hypothetical protein
VVVLISIVYVGCSMLDREQVTQILPPTCDQAL